MSGVPGLLGLLHPDGTANTVVVLGGGCPPHLAVDDPTRTRAADLVVIAPAGAEVREPGWLERAVKSASALAATDAVVYLLVPPGLRATARRLARHAGFVLDTDMLHLPNWEVSHYTIPIRQFTPGAAAETLIPERRQRLLAWALALPGSDRLLGRLHPSTAIVARRPAARPLFDWLLRAVRRDVDRNRATEREKAPVDAAALVVMRAKWRRGTGAVVAQVIDAATGPVAIAKMTLANASDGRIEREVDCLARLGSPARASGAAIPDVHLECVGETPFMVSNVVRGARASDLLAARRVSVDVVLDHLTAWLEQWNHSTLMRRPLRTSDVEHAVLGPARLLAEHLDHGPAYLQWLGEQCRAIVGEVVPLVATHGDLTMSNVLLAGAELGIVDWEFGRSEGWPLRDFWYAAVDAAAAVERYDDRVAAFAQCFRAPGLLRALVTTHEARLVSALDVPDPFMTICFHGCWLQHALDESRKRKPEEPRPFRDIVRSLAASPPLVRTAGVWT